VQSAQNTEHPLRSGEHCDNRRSRTSLRRNRFHISVLYPKNHGEIFRPASVSYQSFFGVSAATIVALR
jgi:hypothetical protein